MLRTALRPLARARPISLWRYHAALAPGREAGASAAASASTPATDPASASAGPNAQGAQMSASSKHPYDPGPGSTDIPRGALKDPAAGPNSRPEMDPVASTSASSGTSAAATPTSGGQAASSGANPTAQSTAGPASASGSNTGSQPDKTEDGVRDPVRGPSSSPHPPTPAPDAVEMDPAPPSLFIPSPRSRHPFDTYAFVSRLEKSQIDSGAARALMEGVRRLIVSRSDEARGTMLSTEEMDNAAYRFKAALSELRTEQSVRTRNDGVALRSAASAMRREVDGLEQQMKVDLQGLRHDVDLELNNRQTDTRSDMSRFDIATEEINNKFTISLGDLRTEIESSKWDATRRAISIIAMLVIGGVALSTFSIPAKPPPVPAAVVSTRDIGVGPDEHHFDDHLDDHDSQDHARVEQHLDALLQKRERREHDKPPSVRYRTERI